MTELWTITRVVASGRETNFGRFWVIEWSNINIFQWKKKFVKKPLRAHFLKNRKIHAYLRGGTEILKFACRVFSQLNYVWNHCRKNISYLKAKSKGVIIPEFCNLRTTEIMLQNSSVTSYFCKRGLKSLLRVVDTWSASP